LFNYWNQKKGFIKHSKYPKKLDRLVKNSEYDNTEITHSIDNYYKILIDNQYYWTHKYTLCDFISRGIDKFLSDECLNNYKDFKQQSKQHDNNKPKFKTLEEL